MSIERELLKRWLIDFGKIHPDVGLIKETKELLAQPEQEPVVKITSIHADGENLPVVITGVVLSDAVNIWDLPIKNNNLLFLAPPKPKPLTPQQISEGNQSMLNVTREAFKQGVIFAEKAHGIGEG